MRLSLTLTLFMALTLAGQALAFQPVHSATLSWTDPNTSASTDTSNVYRAAGACPTTPPSVTGAAPFSKVGSGTAGQATFQDTTVVAGSTYCWYVTEVAAGGGTGSESAPSPTAQATVPALFPPGSLVIVIQ